MKVLKTLVAAVSVFLLVAGTAFSAVVLTDTQIAEIATIAQSGGDVTQAAQDMMAGITSDLIASGLSGDELQNQVAMAVQEMTSGLDAGAGNFETAVAGILQGAASGAVQGVNQAVGADPNLDSAALTASISKGTAGAVAAIVALNPGLNTAGLQAAVNQGLESQGATPLEPEAFGEATEDDTPEETAQEETPTTPEAPVVEAPEAPPTQDDVAASPV